MKLFWLVLGLILSFALGAQNPVIRHIVMPSTNTIHLGDSLWIYPPSVRLRPLHNSEWLSKDQFVCRGDSIRLTVKIPSDSVWIEFRSFPFPVNRYYFLYDSSDHHDPLPPDYSLPGKSGLGSGSSEWWSSPGIAYSGSYNRGLSIGSNQSLILNSALNLQLAGDLGDGIRITGAISDNQLPVQAEGNTRQIQEFDRLYIELKKNSSSLIAGDFDLSKPQGYFMNYFKKSQGGLLQHQQQLGQWKIKESASIGISKGKFNRINIPVVDGNQGPYRLRGRDGENFIIILAASEKVFLDGVQLVRGDDADYVMDYNLGEIRFTPRRLVTAQMRLIIEFEYTDQNYLRSLITTNVSAERKGLTAYINYYRENDSKRPSVSSDLDSLDQLALAASGDDPSGALSLRIGRAGSSLRPDRVYYRYVDTLVIRNGVSAMIRILRYEEHPDSNALQVVFSELGPGKGEYQLVQSNANGRIYQYVGLAPGTNLPLGSYAPYKILIAPRNQQLMTAGLRITPKNEKGLEMNLETAMSYLDKNRLSSIGDSNNLGFAMMAQIRAPIIQKGKWNWQNSASAELNDRQFTSLNPYRNPEFNRDWNIDAQTGYSDRLLRLSSTLGYGAHTRTSFTIQRFNRDLKSSGERYQLEAGWKDSIQNYTVRYDLLQTDWTNQRSKYLRPGIVIARQIFKKWTLAARWEVEKNERFAAVTDSLLASSFSFRTTAASLQYATGDNRNLRMEWKRRTDDAASGKTFSDWSTSDEWTLASAINSTRTGQWDLQMTARHLQFTRAEINDSLGRISFIGQLDHSLSRFRNGLRIKNIYAMQSGAEPRTEYVYEERRPGDGDYIYIDFNHDGIRQIQEYVYAPEIDTARYVRIQLFNSTYVQAYQSTWSSILGVDMGRVMADKKNFTILKKFSFESLLRFISKINEDAPLASRFDPVGFGDQTGRLISYQKSINEQLFYNRANPNYELGLNYLNQASKILLLSGIETKDRRDLNLKTRWSLRSKIDCLVTLGLQQDQRLTNSYSQQNYRIASRTSDLSATWRINRDMRTQWGWKWRQSAEQDNLHEKALVHDLYTVSQLSFQRKASLRIEFKYIRIDYRGTSGTAVEYVMLEGLKNGSNYTAECILDYRFTKLISSQFSYSLRKPSGSDAIQTGRASIRANF